MSLWSLIGLAKKKDIIELSQKLSAMTTILENIIQQNNVVCNSINLIEMSINEELQKVTAKTNNAITAICEANIKHESTIMDLIKNTNECLLNDLSSAHKKLNSMFAFVNDSLKTLNANIDVQAKNDIVNYESINHKLDAILKSISGASKNIISSNRMEIEEHITVIAETISMATSTFSEQNKDNGKRLKNIETLSSKLLEAIKIIWIDNMVENLKIINAKQVKK